MKKIFAHSLCNTKTIRQETPFHLIYDGSIAKPVDLPVFGLAILCKIKISNVNNCKQPKFLSFSYNDSGSYGEIFI